MLATPQGAGFDRDVRHLQWVAAAPAENAKDLEEKLHRLYERLLGTDFSQYNVQHVSGTARNTLQALFDLRIGLRAQIARWQAEGLMSPGVQGEIRNVFRILRYASDIFGELAIGHARAEEGETPFVAFSGPHSNTLVNPDFGPVGDLTFETGDVILVRGLAHNSAAIARIGDNDSQFSHVGLVYVDEVGKRFIVEALIEEGSVIRPLDEMLGHGNVRAVLFRHKDRELAKKSAELIREHVAKSLDGRLPHIPYDFTMRVKGQKQLFCSKLVRLAYDKGSDGTYLLPSFPTKLSMKNRDFVRRIGVLTRETFAPGDMELEPGFDLVAEWRDYRFTSTVRLQDLVMDKLFEWMELRGYKFRQRFPIGLISFMGKLSAYLSLRAKKLLSGVFPVVPRNMKRKTIAAIIMLHKTAEPILQKMMDLEDAKISQNGHQLHPLEVFEEVEKVRMSSGRRIGYLVRPLLGRK